METVKLTKKQSVELCLKMWDILAESGSSSKGSALVDIITEDESLPENLGVHHECFACEYVKQQVGKGIVVPDGDNNCCKAHCPLIGLWPDGCEPGDSCGRGYDFDTKDDRDYCCGRLCCCDCNHYEPEPSTAWTDWRDCGDPEQRKVYAKVIADYCRKLLANWTEG